MTNWGFKPYNYREYVNDIDDQDFPLQEIVTERILAICREKERATATTVENGDNL